MLSALYNGGFAPSHCNLPNSSRKASHSREGEAREGSHSARLPHLRTAAANHRNFTPTPGEE